MLCNLFIYFIAKDLNFETFYCLLPFGKGQLFYFNILSFTIIYAYVSYFIMPAPKAPSRFRKWARRGVIGAAVATIAGTVGWMAIHKDRRFEAVRPADPERIVRIGEPIPASLKPFSKFTFAPQDIAKVQGR